MRMVALFPSLLFAVDLKYSVNVYWIPKKARNVEMAKKLREITNFVVDKNYMQDATYTNTLAHAYILRSRFRRRCRRHS